jgi:hypothetical protein
MMSKLWEAGQCQASFKASSCTVPSTRTAAKRNKAIFQLKPHPIAAPKKSIASMIR